MALNISDILRSGGRAIQPDVKLSKGYSRHPMWERADVDSQVIRVDNKDHNYLVTRNYENIIKTTEIVKRM